MRRETWTVRGGDANRRLDRILRILKADLPLSSIYRAFRSGNVKVNGKKRMGSERVVEGDQIVLFSLEKKSGDDQNKPAVVENEDAANLCTPIAQSSILFENAHLLAINKEWGSLVHGGYNALDNRVRAYLDGRLEQSLSFAPGPMHRLDRNTSGVLCFSKSLKGAQAFSFLLSSRLLEKIYIALLDGHLDSGVYWNDVLERSELHRTTSVTHGPGRRAFTRAEPILVCSGYTLALIRIDSGITHQIRSQAAFHGHPLSGDRKYGGSRKAGGYILHAAALQFPDNGSMGFPRRIDAPLGSEAIFRLTQIFGPVTALKIREKIDNCLN